MNAVKPAVRHHDDLIPGRRIPRNVIDNFICCVKGLGNFSSRADAFNDGIRRQLLILSQFAGSKYTGHHHRVRRIEGLDEFLFKDLSSACLGAGLENGPDPV